MPDPRNFESAMSLLVAAIGHIQNNPATTADDLNRLAEQVSRLDAICTRNNRRISQ